MKKVFAILALGFLASCGSNETKVEDTPNVADSVVNAAVDTTVKVADSTVTAVIDSTKAAVVDSLKK